MLLENLPNLIFSLVVFGFFGLLAGVFVSILGNLDSKFQLMVSVPAVLLSLLISIFSFVLIVFSREPNMRYWNLLNFGLSAFFYYMVTFITSWICKKFWAMF